MFCWEIIINRSFNALNRSSMSATSSLRVSMASFSTSCLAASAAQNSGVSSEGVEVSVPPTASLPHSRAMSFSSTRRCTSFSCRSSTLKLRLICPTRACSASAARRTTLVVLRFSVLIRML